jgi:phosphoribosylaminoimidazolecarboxamide formyltransferase/IMP cyclohydrolase
VDVKIERALISAWSKDGVAAFGRFLADRGVEILSTGGTARCLKEAGIPVVDVADVTGFPEMMDGRVKTLHPLIFGGLLYRRGVPEHEAAARSHGIPRIDLLVVDLYPFEGVASDANAARPDCIEMIDVGGPAMIRAAAKNHAHVVVVTDPADLAMVRGEMDAKDGGVGEDARCALAAKAFRRTAAYDATIAGYLTEDPFPERLVLTFERHAQTRYGENPHQSGAVYSDGRGGDGVAGAVHLSGKELSYNNYLDAAAAWEVVRGRSRCAVSVIKHKNPCGAAVGDDPVHVFRAAYGGDPLSAFGGILAINREVTLALAQAIADPAHFFEVIVAKGFSAEAVSAIQEGPRWGKSVRLLATGSERDVIPGLDVRSIRGGLHVQEADGEGTWEPTIVTKALPDDATLLDLRFAWSLVRHVTSNGIVLVQDQTLVGCGAGQMSRVDAVDIATKKAGDRARGAVMGSDAFFPFPDGILAAVAAGVRAVIQPGGSRRDPEVIEACDQAGVAMAFTGRRHFRH